MDYNDLFEMGGFASKGDDDLLQATVLTEGTEFAPDSNATNDVSNHVQDASVSVPGGLKEQPTAKPADGEKSVPVPGGLSEKPTNPGVPGFANVGNSGKVVLTDAQHNAAMQALQKSFKEGVEMLDILMGAQVVHETADDITARMMEESMNEACLVSFEDGPFFEAVQHEDKKEVKKLCRELRPKIQKDCIDDKVTFVKANAAARLISGLLIAAGGGALTVVANSVAPAAAGVVSFAATHAGASNMAAGMDQIWRNHLWQVLGVVHLEEGNVKTYVDNLNEKYKEELGEYKFMTVRTSATIGDCFRSKFNWKNAKNVYFLIIDKKMPAEIQKFQKAVDEAIKDGEKKDGKEEKEEKKD